MCIKVRIVFKIYFPDLPNLKQIPRNVLGKMAANMIFTKSPIECRLVCTIMKLNTQYARGLWKGSFTLLSITIKKIWLACIDKKMKPGASTSCFILNEWCWYNKVIKDIQLGWYGWCCQQIYSSCFKYIETFVLNFCSM